MQAVVSVPAGGDAAPAGPPRERAGLEIMLQRTATQLAEWARPLGTPDEERARREAAAQRGTLEGVFTLLASLPPGQMLVAAAPLLDAGLEHAAEIVLATSAPFAALLEALRAAAEARGDGRVSRLVDAAEGAAFFERGRALHYFPKLGRTTDDDAAGERANAEAEPLLRRSLALRERALGREAPETEASAAMLGACLFFLDRATEAEPLLRRALALRERTLGADAAEAIEAADMLAIALAMQGKEEEALPIFVRVLDWRTEALGTAHQRTLDALGNHARCARAVEMKRDYPPDISRLPIASIVINLHVGGGGVGVVGGGGSDGSSDSDSLGGLSGDEQ